MNGEKLQSMLQVQMTRDGSANRRRFLHMSGATLAASGLLGRLSLQADEARQQQRACILVWLGGGPSQFEMWDPKPNTANGGQTTAISTAVSGVQVAEHWPKMAKMLKDVALIRSMTNKEGSHERATYHLHTGRPPTGSLKFPNFGSVMASEKGDPESELPNFVSIGDTLGAGFLGVKAQPFVVRAPGRLPENVANLVSKDRLQRRLLLLREQDKDFAASGASDLAAEHYGLYKQAAKLMLAPKLKAFEFKDEKPQTVAKYGNTVLGKGLLVARRLIESGVPFVEVRERGWDNHRDIFKVFPRKAAVVDHGLSTLLQDLKERGMLESTLVVCLGEFGRTPKINPNGGRDHFPKAFGLAMAGGGVRGGQVIGSTTDDGSEVQDRPVTVNDLFQSICEAVQLAPETEIYTPQSRPLKVVDGGSVVSELFG